MALGNGSIQNRDLLGLGDIFLFDIAIFLPDHHRQEINATAVILVVVGVLVTELSRIVGATIRRGTRNNLGVLLITSSLVRAASGLVLIVVRDGVRLVTDAARRGRAVHGTIGASAIVALAVDADGAVSASAERQISRGSGDVKGVHVRGKRILSQLVVVVRLTLHDDVLVEILVTVHASSELDHGIIDGEAGDVWDTRLLAGSQLDEAGGSGHALVVRKDLSGLGAVGRLFFVLSSNGS